MNWGSWGVNHSSEMMSELIKDAFSNGINSFDHADIYGGYTTEESFGEAFLKTGIKREDVFFISKCGIMYPSDRLPVKVKHYDYSAKHINQSVINYFKKEGIEISELSYFDIASDLDIGKVDPDHLFNILIKKDLSNSDALFISCTALPALSIIKDLEKKTGKVVLSSNQTLIWDTLKKIDFKNKVAGYGELFNN